MGRCFGAWYCVSFAMAGTVSNSRLGGSLGSSSGPLMYTSNASAVSPNIQVQETASSEKPFTMPRKYETVLTCETSAFLA